MYLAAAEPGWHTAMLACWQGFQLISHPAMEPYWFGSCKPVGCASLHRMPFDGAEKPLELAHSLFCLDLIMKMLVILCKIIAFGVSTVLPSHSQGKKKGELSHIVMHLDSCGVPISPSPLVQFHLCTPL